ncbi:hypothetical protein OAG62_01965 [bacterium]|nr:hypothetical protein [bacterium]
MMLVFPFERLTFLCTPKCASTSVEEVYAPYAGVVLGGHPKLKHVDLSAYERGFAPLTGEDLGSLETVCLVRDPMEHLKSWYRYSRRPDLKNRKWSQHGRTFEDFVEDFLDVDQGWTMKTQHEFVQDETGQIGVNRIFALEHVDRFVDFMNERLGVRAGLPALNASAPASTSIASGLEADLRCRLAPDFALHEAVLKAEEGWQNPLRKFESRPAPKRGSTAAMAVNRSRRQAKAAGSWFDFLRSKR